MDLHLAYFTLREIKKLLLEGNAEILAHKRFIPTELEALDVVIAELKHNDPDIEIIHFVPTDAHQ